MRFISPYHPVVPLR